ncbi:hypothetical protein [Aeromonas salmonicida]|uniref:hypothetical protein n=1 Tax=Aeromonas salmonicida TaxID=645 RepID=UPI00232C244E|nr:hypothetical protein [Aeromonas salmonicida]WCH25235.1 hypothetical protein ONZ54_22945 [Aeromonas salmonicida]
MITLSGKDLVELLDFMSPDREQDPEQLEAEVSIIKLDKLFADGVGDVRPPGVYAYLTEYPEEGLYGPLGTAEGA